MNQVELPGFLVDFDQWRCRVLVSRYTITKNLRLDLVDAETGEPIATASVNHPDFPLPDGRVMIKDWNENEGMIEALQAAKLIGSREVAVTPKPPYRVFDFLATVVGL